MLSVGMRLWVLLFMCGCSAHIDLKFQLLQGATDCAPAAAGNPPVPMTCDQLTLDCADHLLLRVRQADTSDIISSRCVPLMAERDLCALEKLSEPISLIDSVPEGTRFKFQLAALHFNHATASLPATTGCDDDTNPPIRVFTGTSNDILVDGKDHTLDLMLTSCGSCANLPGSQASDLGFVLHDMGQPASDLGAPSDMAFASDGAIIQDLSGVDLVSLPDLTPPPDLAQSQCHDYSSIGGGSCCPAPVAPCVEPGSLCNGGGHAQLPPGGCCATCD